MSDPDQTRPSRAERRAFRGAQLGLPPTGVGSLASPRERGSGMFLDFLVLLPVAIISLATNPDHRVRVVNPRTGAVSSHLVRVGRPVWAVVLLLLPAALYTIFTIGRWGQTLGQRRMGLKVVRLRGGGPPGYDLAVARWVTLGLISFLLALRPSFSLLLNLLWVLVLAWQFWDPLTQGLHDKVAGVLVVRTRDEAVRPNQDPVV